MLLRFTESVFEKQLYIFVHFFGLFLCYMYLFLCYMVCLSTTTFDHSYPWRCHVKLSSELTNVFWRGSKSCEIDKYKFDRIVGVACLSSFIIIVGNFFLSCWLIMYLAGTRPAEVHFNNHKEWFFNCSPCDCQLPVSDSVVSSRTAIAAAVLWLK